MTLPVQRSLFESDSNSTLTESVDWAVDLLSGSVGGTLAVMAVAFLGFLAFSGAVPIRRGAQVVLGIFVLFGAPTIATAFTEGLRTSLATEPAVVFDVTSDVESRGDLEPILDTTEIEVERALAAQEDAERQPDAQNLQGAVAN